MTAFGGFEEFLGYPETDGGIPRRWDVNAGRCFRACCCKAVCKACNRRLGATCPLCREPRPETEGEVLARLRSHVDRNNPAAVCKLGACYAAGDLGLEASDATATRLYARAAALGSVEAAYNLGCRYWHGRGVGRDATAAAGYWRDAAASGNAKARCNLGECYRKGEGVPRDVLEAARLFRLAAAQGHTRAAYNLGAVRESRGDEAGALRAYAKAAARGHKEGRRAHRRLRATMIAPDAENLFKGDDLLALGLY